MRGWPGETFVRPFLMSEAEPEYREYLQVHRLETVQNMIDDGLPGYREYLQVHRPGITRMISKNCRRKS